MVVVGAAVVEEVVVDEGGGWVVVDVAGSVEPDVADGGEAAAEHPAKARATTPPATSAASRGDRRFAFAEMWGTSEDWAKKAARARTALTSAARGAVRLLK